MVDENIVKECANWSLEEKTQLIEAAKKATRAIFKTCKDFKPGRVTECTLDHVGGLLYLKNMADELPSNHRSKDMLEKIYGTGVRKPGIIYKAMIDEANRLIEKETKKTGKGPLNI